MTSYFFFGRLIGRHRWLIHYQLDGDLLYWRLHVFRIHIASGLLGTQSEGNTRERFIRARPRRRGYDAFVTDGLAARTDPFTFDVEDVGGLLSRIRRKQ